MPALTETQLEQFNREGFLVVEDIYDKERDFGPIMAEYSELLGSLCEQWYSERRLPSAFQELSFSDKFTEVVAADLPVYQHFDITLPQVNLKPGTPMHTSAAVFNLLRNPNLLDAVESIVGPEILSSPIQHTRVKVPEHRLPAHLKHNNLVGTTCWHQDQGVGLPEIDKTNMLSVWFPMGDTDKENGCLKVVPRSNHKGLITHCPAPGKLEIPLRFIEKDAVTPVPMKAGSVMLFTRTTMHASYDNNTERLRWSFDLRYLPVGQPTGRPMFPDFVARSRSNPASELRDAAVWADLWMQARARVAAANPPVFNRWNSDHPLCA